MRKKWEEIVTYTEVSEPDIGERKTISMFNGGNGDLYMAIHDENKGFAGKAIRIERSGGAITRNPAMVRALTNLYDILAENEIEKPMQKKSYDIEELIQIIEDINVVASDAKERGKLKKKLIKNFRNEYIIIEK